ncbi:MAG TPA: cation acetate symporter [Intrasporangiaceae bacterium]|nr:cation acetate symporter [Intrasporangiaceae bacterium]
MTGTKVDLFAVTAIVLVCAATLVVGFFGLRLSRTTSDFYVASRQVGPTRNASAISGEYLSAASFLGVAGLIYERGFDSLWLPVGYTSGYVVLLVLVAAPLRRSGAYTIPDFAEMRMQSQTIRRFSALLVVAIGWLYLLPQFQGAGLSLRSVTGWPTWVGPVVVVVTVTLGVAAGGMRSITLVQAMQYWLKLCALAIPAFVLLFLWTSQGSPGPREIAGGGTVLREWYEPLVRSATDPYPLYSTYSTLLALCLGTMGLPHVLVRFYTNPDGKAARRTTVVVIGLIGMFYLMPPIYGVLARVYLPQLGVEVPSDQVVLQLPKAAFPGLTGDLLAAILAGGAFAAFLSTASGLVVSIAGVLAQDVLRPALAKMTTGDSDVIQSFRLATFIAVLVPLIGAVFTAPLGLARTVNLAFAIAASTLAPLLLLGVWWRRLTVPGAFAGLFVGGGLAAAATGITVVFRPEPGWLATVLSQPAAWCIPAAFATMMIGSLLTQKQIPPGTPKTMARLHTPEGVELKSVR